VNADASTAVIEPAGPGDDGGMPRWLRFAGYAFAGFLVAIATLLLLLRIVLAGMPERADRVKAWVERQTRLKLEFSSLDARLRWYGPELVLYDLRILDREGREPMLAMREGSVALDLWNVLRAGEFVAGRVSFSGPAVTLIRLEDGSFRLLGLGERPTDRPPFDFDRLPAGRVQIADATVHLRDLKTHAKPLTLEDLDLVLRRDRDRVVARGSARLPKSLGTRLGFEAELDGTLAEPLDLAGRVDLEIDRLLLAGLADFLPSGVARPLAGSGRVNARVAFRERQLRTLRVDLELREPALAMAARRPQPVEILELTPARRSPGSPPLSMPEVDKNWRRREVSLPAVVKYVALAGSVDLRRVDGGWSFDVRDLRAVREGGGRRSAPAASLSGEFRGRLLTRHSLKLDAHELRLEDLWPLVLAAAPRSAERWLGLAPQGEIRRLVLVLDRSRAGAVPVFEVEADVDNLGAEASGAWPGLKGLTATITGTDTRGRAALRSRSLDFRWPRMFTAAAGPIGVTGDVEWHRDGRAWVFASRKMTIEHAQAHAHGGFELRYVGGTHPSRLRVDASLERADAAIVRAFLPYGRLRPKSIAWLAPAFVRGTATGGAVHIDGPLRGFPYRNGGGEMKIAFDVRDVTLDYFPGFTPLRDAAGRVVIENGGLNAELTSGRVGALAVRRGWLAIADLKAPVIDIDASGGGDLAAALGMLQKSPLGPVLGRQFMRLVGSGDTAIDLKLHLTPREPENRDYEVRTRLSNATVSLPLLRAPAEQVSGELLVARREIRSSDLRGTFLGGPFSITVAPGDSSTAELDSVIVEGNGRAAGAELPGFIGLPRGIQMSGGLDWTLALAAQRQQAGEPWPTQLEVSSDLRGLAIDAPPPFAKSASDPRRTGLTLDYAPGGPTEIDVRSGAAHARVAFRDRDGKAEFDRGALRFDERPLALPANRGLQIDGDWPDFDLGRWLALGGGGGDGPARRALSDWLGPVNVRLVRARVFGYELKDVDAVLATSDLHWQVDLAGPQAAGQVRVPFDLRAGSPIVLDLQRLHLISGSSGAAQAEGKPADPRRMPALVVAADEFVWRGRRLGRVRANIVKDPQGLRLQRFTAESPAMQIAGSGRWLAEGATSRSAIELEATITDLAAASVALGYRDTIEAEHTRLTANLSWPGGPSADAVGRMDGRVHVELDKGQLRNVEPGAAGRVLGLMSVVELPRRLALDFRDVTDEGLAFDSVRGDFDVRDGNAYTQNLLLTGTAVDIGVAGRTGLASQDYDQTVIVSGNPSGPLTVAGALAAGPVIGAGVLVLSQLFKGQLKGLTRAYYRVTGPWAAPVVERISAPEQSAPAAQEAAAALTE
jgi:uncharacterized protein (TIGR02099 family)